MEPSARGGYVKACRKQGEFAHAIAAVLIDPEKASARAVIGAVETTPIVLGDAAALFGGRVSGDFNRQFDARVADAILMQAGIADPAGPHIHVAGLRRATKQAAAGSRSPPPGKPAAARPPWDRPPTPPTFLPTLP